MQLAFPSPVTFTGTAACFDGFFAGESHEWSVAVADSVEDMELLTGSYMVAVPERTVTGSWWLWDSASLAEPVTASVVRLTAERIGGDNSVHFREWTLEGAMPACGSGVDLSEDPVLPVVVDVDSIASTGPQDIGADQTHEVLVGFEDTYYQGWETEDGVHLDVVLSAPAALPVTVRYMTLGGSATPGEDFSAVQGTAVFAPGETRWRVTIPLVDDGPGEDPEQLVVALYEPAGCRLRGEWTNWVTVEIQEGNPLPRASFAVAELSATEGDATVLVEVVLDRPGVDTARMVLTARDGSARTGVDFWPSEGSLTFEPGETSNTFELHLIDDGEPEADETIRLGLRSPSGCIKGTPQTGVVTIVDDDQPPPLAVDPDAFGLDLTGCIPALVGGPGAVTALGSPVTIEVLADNQGPVRDLVLEPFSIASGQPFAVKLRMDDDHLDLGAVIEVTATYDGSSTTETVAAVAEQGPVVATESVTVVFEDDRADVTIPFEAVTGRLEDLRGDLENLATGVSGGLYGGCEYDPYQPYYYYGSVEAEVGDEVVLQLCHGMYSEECAEISLGDGTGR